VWGESLVTLLAGRFLSLSEKVEADGIVRGKLFSWKEASPLGAGKSGRIGDRGAVSVTYGRGRRALDWEKVSIGH
jgi:hypothetical protein